MDEDNDFWPTCTSETSFQQDCDDGDETVSPWAPPGCDGRDHNCNGIPDTEEPDGCTPSDPEGARADSAMLEETLLLPPSQPWPEGCVDEDNDFWPTCTSETGFQQDCDDSDETVSPWAPPGCDGRDHNCNGIPDTEEPGGCTPSDPEGGRGAP